MKRTLFILIGGLLTVTACQTESDEPSSLVNYAQLPEIGIELVVETGESDGYLPGRMWELALTSDGGFLVSDSQTNTIEQYSADGVHLVTVAVEGDGPGELPPFFRLIPGLEDDTIAVHHSSGQFDYFSPGIDNIYRHRRSVVPGQTEAATARFTVLAPYTGTSFFAGMTGRIVNSMTDEEINAIARVVTVHLINERSEVKEDSLYQLTYSNGYLEVSRSGGNISAAVYGLPYQNVDRLLSLGNGSYLIARPGSGTITFYDSQHQLEDEIELKAVPRPVTDSDLDYHLESITSSTRRNAMEERVPEFKPPFLDLWVNSDHILLLTDEQETGKEIVVYTIEGEPLGKFNIPEIDQVQAFRGNQLYTIHRNQEMGDQVRVYELDL